MFTILELLLLYAIVIELRDYEAQGDADHDDAVKSSGDHAYESGDGHE